MRSDLLESLGPERVVTGKSRCQDLNKQKRLSYTQGTHFTGDRISGTGTVDWLLISEALT